MESWLRETVKDLELYYNPKIKAIRMDTSVNVVGANPAIETVLHEGANLEANQYPSPYSDNLRKALAEKYSLHEDNFVVGNGSDEVLDISFKSFLNPNELVIAPYPSYVLHEFFVKINGGRFATVDLRPDFQLDVEAMLEPSSKMIILCTPNNPTANCFKKADVQKIIEGHEGPVIVDEAYGEYATDSFISQVDEFDNLIVTRTFSKAYGLAGLRVGYMATNKKLANALQKVKIPYSLNKVSEAVAIAALQDTAYLQKGQQVINEQRTKLSAGLQALGFEVFPSESNFIMFRTKVPSAEFVARLAAKGILIRDFGKRRLLENCVRTTIGTEELHTLLLTKIHEVNEEW